MRTSQLVRVAAVALAAAAAGFVVLARSAPARAAYTADRLPIAPVVAGYRRAYALQDGLVKGWGYAAAGELGDGAAPVLAQPLPQPIAGLTNVKQVAHSFDHSVVLKDDGTVWTWGNNAKGQLGRAGSVSVPMQVPGLSGASWVEAGNRTSYAIVGGRIYAWGLNDLGQLGLGDTINRSTPTLVPTVTSTTRVRAGYLHALAITSTGALYAWGNNSAGQLGNGTTTDALTPVLLSLRNVTAIAAGLDHSIALDSTRNVWTWGDDTVGQLGNDAAMSGFVTRPVRVLSGGAAVAAGMFHNLVLRTTNEVWAWGGNENGQLGDAGVADVFVPVKTTLKEPVRFISAGYYGGAAVTRHGDLYVWGWNGYGQYGNGTTDGSATGGNFGRPTKSNHFYTYNVLLLAVAKANTWHIPDMQSQMPALAANISRLSYGKVRFKVAAATSTYLATAADLACTGDLGIDELKLLNFATTKAKAEGFVLSRYHHVMTNFDYDLTENYGCRKPGAQGGMVNATGQAVTVPLLGKDTGWLSEALAGVVGVHEFEHGYGMGGLRPHTGQITCNGASPLLFDSTCTWDDDAPNNMYALGGGFVPFVSDPVEFNENVAYKNAWQWIEPGRVKSLASSTPGSFTVKLNPSDEATLASTDYVAVQVPLPMVNGATRALYLEYRLHARIGNAPANANRPGVYALYYENSQALLMKLGADDPNTFNGHKPLSLGVQSTLDPKVKVTLVNLTAAAATVKVDILP